MTERLTYNTQAGRFVSGALFLFFSLLVLASCKDKKKDNDNTGAFNKKQMLQSMADQLIVPAVIRLDDAIATLQVRVLEFNDHPSTIRLDSIRECWKNAYLANLWCNVLNYGPGEQLITGTYFENTGLWPVNTLKIEERIQNGLTDFSNDFERDTRGFLALDYLLFQDASASDLLNGSIKRLNYLTALTDHLRSWSQRLRDGWNGPYRQTFINNDGKDAGSSISLFYNEFVKSYEAMKNYKLGIPAGKRVGQSGPEPELVEAYYSGISIACVSENMKVVETIWYGRSLNGAEGVGFDDWLKSIPGGDQLRTETISRMEMLREKINALPQNQRLSDLVLNQPAQVEDLFNACQAATRFFKSDLSSMIGIAITFNDGDGD